MQQKRPLRLAVLLSGTGRTLENLLAAIARGELNATVDVVISSVQGVRGIEIAEAAGIPAAVFTRRAYPDLDSFSDAVYAVLEPIAPDLILFAGFLRQLQVRPGYEGRILNIHPGLLPEGPSGKGMYGAHVHAAVLRSGASRSGATVHVVDQEYDTGPVVKREVVPVIEGDSVESLAARVFAAECRLYPAAIRAYVARHPELFFERSLT
jgi:formyltetrahydrofolate-dependent phosphoribosylglycinamide formyltransferase